MEQVFTNLLSNARQIRSGRIDGACDRPCAVADAVEVEVWNEGPPVPAEHLDRIFGSDSIESRMPIVSRAPVWGYRFAKDCRSPRRRIWAENRPDGFAYHVRLPVSPSETPA
jgi:two-component system sensor histidine kinase KdpD